MPDLSSSTIARQELEECWRRKLEKAYDAYQTASTRYRSLLREEPEGQIRSPEGPLSLARREESETLAEYTRLLKIFTELTVDRRMPQAQSASSAEGERE